MLKKIKLSFLQDDQHPVLLHSLGSDWQTCPAPGYFLGTTALQNRKEIETGVFLHDLVWGLLLVFPSFHHKYKETYARG